MAEVLLRNLIDLKRFKQPYCCLCLRANEVKLVAPTAVWKLLDVFPSRNVFKKLKAALMNGRVCTWCGAAAARAAKVLLLLDQSEEYHMQARNLRSSLARLHTANYRPDSTLVRTNMVVVDIDGMRHYDMTTPLNDTSIPMTATITIEEDDDDDDDDFLTQTPAKQTPFENEPPLPPANQLASLTKINQIMKLNQLTPSNQINNNHHQNQLPLVSQLPPVILSPIAPQTAPVKTTRGRRSVQVMTLKPRLEAIPTPTNSDAQNMVLMCAPGNLYILPMHSQIQFKDDKESIIREKTRVESYKKTEKRPPEEKAFTEPRKNRKIVATEDPLQRKGSPSLDQNMNGDNITQTDNETGLRIMNCESQQDKNGITEMSKAKMNDRVDWEDKIPMDVISFVDAFDPLTVPTETIIVLD